MSSSININIYSVIISFFISSLSLAQLPTENVKKLTDSRYQFIKNEIVFNELPGGQEGEYIKYGYLLLSKTSELLGPNSPLKINVKSHMSCRNCHIGVGTVEYGNSFLDTHALYPQYRAREGKIQTLAQRINACFTHPMQGKPLPENSKEMMAIQMYMKWIGANRVRPSSDPDNRIAKIEFLDRAADPKQGKIVYEKHCLQCHGENGEGKFSENGKSFMYPPLWGKESFIIGSSMSRLSVLARFIGSSMPYLSEIKLDKEQSWDVAAFIMSNSKPAWNGKKPPFKNLSEKPFDFPKGPYDDHFSEERHKYGPYKEIIDYWVKKKGQSTTRPSGI